MKRLIRKSSTEFCHLTSTYALRSILEKGLLPRSSDSSGGIFTGNNVTELGEEGVYVGTENWKETCLEMVQNDTDYALIIISNLDTNKLIIDPEQFFESGNVSSGSDETLLTIAKYCFEHNLDKGSFKDELIDACGKDYRNAIINAPANDDILQSFEECIQEDTLRQLPWDLIPEIDAWVYIGSIPPSQISEIYIYDRKFNPKDIENIEEYAEEIGQSID